MQECRTWKGLCVSLAWRETSCSVKPWAVLFLDLFSPVSPTEGVASALFVFSRYGSVLSFSRWKHRGYWMRWISGNAPPSPNWAGARGVYPTLPPYVRTGTSSFVTAKSSVLAVSIRLKECWLFPLGVSVPMVRVMIFEARWCTDYWSSSVITADEVRYVRFPKKS